jgi:hypothetical protein
MSNGPDRDYDVGYGKPPLRTRWKKGGPSPNPSGRPKQPKDLTAIVDRIANEPVRGKGANAGVEMTSQEAIYRREIIAAMHGDQRATASLIREIKRCRLILPKLSPEEDVRGGWLVVPGMMTPEAFERRYGPQDRTRDTHREKQEPVLVTTNVRRDSSIQE